MATTVIKVSFRQYAYSAEDAAALRALLSPIGSVRTKGYWAPMAGGYGELDVIIEFIGLALVTGFIGQAGAKVFDAVAGAISEFADGQRQRGATEPHVLSVTVSFDDFDAHFHFQTARELGDFQSLVEIVYEQLQTPPLKDMRIFSVTIPMEEQRDAWYPPISARGLPIESLRFWGIDDINVGVVTKIYDSEKRELLDVPIERIWPTGPVRDRNS